MAAYTQCLRCAGAPRRPAGGSGLSLPFLLGMPLSMTPGSSIIASPELRCRHRLRRVLSGSALPILPQSVSRGARISGLPDSRICYGLPSCSPPLYGSDRYTRPPRAFTSRLPTDRSPSPLPDISTTATGLLCWRDSHPLEWQLASLHQNRAGPIRALGSHLGYCLATLGERSVPLPKASRSSLPLQQQFATQNNDGTTRKCLRNHYCA